MDNTNKGDPRKTPRCHIEGWELLMRLSGGKSEEQWTACNDGTGEPGGIVRILKIPAYDGEADVLRENGFPEERISRHFRDCAEGELREIESITGSGMPHIPKILKSRLVTEDDGSHRLYILSEYMHTFSEFYAERKINRATLLSLCCDICDALEEYRALGITHNNVQLENVFVSGDGRCLLGCHMPKAQLLSRLLNPSDSRLLRFIAPEVANGADFDGRADIYSLGLTMYFKFNGNRLPFITSEKGMVTKSEADAAILRRLDGEAIPAPIKADEGLAKIILRACAHDPADRYETAAELRTAIVEYAKAAGVALTVPETTAVPAPAKESAEPSKTAGAAEIDLFAAQLAYETHRNKDITADSITLDDSSSGSSDIPDEISFAAFFSDERNNNVPSEAEQSDDAAPNEAEKEESQSKEAPGENKPEEAAAEGSDAQKSSSVSDRKDYSAENGYFDEDGNFVVVSAARKESETGESAVSAETDADESTEDGFPEDGEEERHRLPILKITLAIFLLVLVVIAAVITLYKFGAFGNPTGTKPVTGEQTESVTDPVTDTAEDDTIDIPDLYGMTEEEAYTALSESGYDGALTIYGGYSSDAAAGLIIGQNPEKDTTVSSDTAIELIVSLGTAPDAMPDVTGLIEKDASSRLSSLGYNVTALSAYSDKFEAGQVAHQSISPDSAITADETVYLVISLGAAPADHVATEEISIGDSFALKPGESTDMPITFTPENASEKDVWWISDAPEIVSVDDTGKITALADGTANISVFSADGEHSATCKVTVSDNVVKVAGIGFRVSAVTMAVGDAESHAPWLTPSNVTNTYVTFSSSDPSVVTVNAYGRITAIAPGTAEITSRSSDGGFTASYTVTVTAPEGKTVVPTLSGLTEADAVAKAKAEGLSASVSYAVSTSVPKGTVISQDLASGAMVDTGSTVTLSVSNGTSEWSEWSETKPAGNAVIESKTQWSFREKKIATQEGSPIDGWTVDTAKTAYSEWGDWTEWSTTPELASDTAEVESKIQYSSRTVEQWSEWDFHPVTDPGMEVESRTVYRNAENTDWVTEPPTADAAAYTQFRFRSQNPYGEWSEFADGEVTASDTLEVQTRVVYRARTRTVTYTCYTYTEWSEWSDTEAVASETIEVDTRTLYRCKVVE